MLADQWFPFFDVAKDDVEIMIDNDMLSIVGKAQPEESGEPVYRETYVGGGPP